jgi:outer membrane receptor protein involved in Fe transport
MTIPAARSLTVLVLLSLAVGLASAAAQVGKPAADTARVRRLDPINVTATRDAREGFRTPQPVVVTDSVAAHRQQAYTASDLFRSAPGVDITGAGSNQARLAIRGHRGQRILLLENGIRLNNSRRQQDFGELPALSDVENLERAELVRGPASVLYGTDAIGGVVNLITAAAPLSGGSRIGGEVGYRYSSHDRQQRPAGHLVGRVGGVGFRASATYRDTEPYEAPAGTFGSLTLDQPVRVHDSGVQDANYALELAVPPAEGHRLSARFARYEARRAGFGYVAGSDLGTPDAPFIRIFYPWQSFNQFSVRYGANGVGSVLADRVDVTGYYQSNARDFNLDVFVPFGPGTPPGAGVQVASQNYTDLDTWGARVEAAKIVAGRHTLTYGVDYFRDDSFNTDSSASTVVGFGPPRTTTSTVPPVPNSTFRSGGIFAQAALAVAPRLLAVLGARVQDVRAATRATPGVTMSPVSSDDQTVVWATNLLYELTPTLGLVLSAGRAFRSPNLVERFFNGPTPEGSGFQVRNPGLKPEASVNVDLGAKFRSGAVYLEGFYYRSTIRNGIRIEATGEQVGPFPAFRNVNVAKLRDQGVELLGEARLGSGLGGRLSYSYHSAEDALDESNPVGDTFSSKLAAELWYDDPSGRFWLGTTLRHNGTRKDVDLESAVIGPVLPAFTVLGAAGGARLFRHGRMTHSVTVAVTNLTNRLYAEFPNASFFRPEPGRSVTATYRLGF